MSTTSFLITAYLAGSGKTWLLVSLFVDDGSSLFLVPTHEAMVNVQNTARAQGKTINNLFVIANFLTNNKTHAEQLFSLRRFKHIYLDEVFQVNKNDIKNYTKLKYNSVQKYMLLERLTRTPQLILTMIITI